MTAVAVEPKQRVVLIDLSALYWRNWHATKDKPVSEAFHLTLQDVRRCSNPGDLVAVCCDSGKSFRKELYPEYKANRPEKDQQAIGELRRTQERLKQDGYLLWTAVGFEADDVIATACDAAVGSGHEVLICSADKDLMQLVGHGVRYRRTDNGQEGGAREVLGKFGVGPSLLGDYLAIVGDDGDNIKGAPDVGPVHAVQALTKWGNLAALGVALEKDIGACGRCKPKRKNEEGEPFAWAKSINDNWDQIMLARKLIELRKDVPIEFTEIYGVRQVQEPNTADEEISFMVKTDSQQDQATSVPSPAEIPASSPDSRTGRDESDSDEGEPVSVALGDAPRSGATGSPGELPPPISIQGELIKFEPANDAKKSSIVSVQFERQLEPYDLGEALMLAKAIFKSKLYTKFTSPMAVFTVIVRGREMGFPAGVSMDLFHFIEQEGKLALTSNSIHTLAERLPDCEYIYCVHTDDRYAEWETKHKKHPSPERLRYTIEEAVQAGLCGLEPQPKSSKPGEKDRRGNWDKRRQNMLRKTARDNLIGMVYPSARSLYSAEELGADIND